MEQRLDLALDDAIAAPGKPVRGTLYVSDPPTDRPRKFALQSRWQATVEGNEAKTGTVDHGEAVVEPGQQEGVFEVEAPNGPPTFTNQFAELSWTLEAREVDPAESGKPAGASAPFELEAPNPTADRGATSGEFRGPVNLGGDHYAASFLQEMLQSVLGALGRPTSVRELRQTLRHIPVGTGPYERANSIWRQLPGLLVTLAIGGVFAFLATTAAVPNVAMYIGGAILAVILGIQAWGVFKAVRNSFAERLLGDVQVDVVPERMNDDTTVGCSLAFSPEDDVELNSIDATLKCVRERRVRGRRRNRHGRGHHGTHNDWGDTDRRGTTYTRRETLNEYPLPFLVAPRQMAAGEPFSGFEIGEVPADAPCSYFYSAPWWLRMLPIPTVLKEEVKWVVEVHIDIEGSPDWVTQYKCVVFP